MAEKLGDALLDLRTSDKGFDQGVNRAEKRADGLGRRLDLVGSKARKLGKMLAIGAAAGAGALALLVKHEVDLADEMSKSAQRAGVTTEALSRLAWAGQLSDVALSDLTNGLQRLSYTMRNAITGADKEASDVFKELGISLTDAEGNLRSADKVMADVAESFSKMEDGSNKTAIAMRLFGRAGAKMLTLLNQGKSGLNAMAAEADRLGLTIDTKTGVAAEHFNDTMTRIGTLATGLSRKIALGIVPELQKFADKLADPEFADNAQALAASVVGALSTIIDAVNATVNALQSVGDTIAWLSSHDMFGNEIGQPGRADGVPTLEEYLRNQQREQAKQKVLDQFRKKGLGETSAPGGDFYQGFGFPSEADTSKATMQVAEVSKAIDNLRSKLKGGETDKPGDFFYQGIITDKVKKDLSDIPALGSAASKSIDQVDKSLANAQQAGQFFGNTLTDAITGLIDGSLSLEDALQNVASALLQTTIQSALLGQGPLSGLFGTASPDGGMGGIFGALFSGFHAKGGLIPNGTFGIVGEKGPEPVIGTSHGAIVRPNSTLSRTAQGAEVNVQVINNAAADTETNVSQDKDGNVMILIDKIVADNVSKVGSRTNKALRSGFALSNAVKIR